MKAPQRLDKWLSYGRMLNAIFGPVKISMFECAYLKNRIQAADYL